MYEYWIKYRIANGNECLVIMPSRMKVLIWLLRYGWRCSSVSIAVMLDI